MEGGGEREAGFESSARAPQRASPGAAGSAACAARAPATGRPTGQRPSLELGQLPTTDTVPDTAPHRAGHYNGHYFPAPDIAPYSLPPGSGRFLPPSAGAQTLSPPQAPTSVLLHPSAGTLLPDPFSPRASSLPGSDPSTSSFSDLPAARATLPAPPFPDCWPGCLSPGDCGGSSAAVEASLFCIGTTGTASLAGTGTRTKTTRPLSYGPQVQRAAGG